MKALTYFTILCIVTIGLFISCQKEIPGVPLNNICDTVYVKDTIYVRDTIRIHDTITVPAPQLTNTQILVQKDWQVDELFTTSGGTTKKYKRGGINTTGVTYQNMRFHFNSNGTGTYIDEVGTSHTMNWNFTTADERNINLNMGAPFPVTFVWNMTEVKNNYIHSTSEFPNGMLSARYIQIP